MCRCPNTQDSLKSVSPTSKQCVHACSKRFGRVGYVCIVRFCTLCDCMLTANTKVQWLYSIPGECLRNRFAAIVNRKMMSCRPVWLSLKFFNTKLDALPSIASVYQNGTEGADLSTVPFPYVRDFSKIIDLSVPVLRSGLSVIIKEEEGNPPVDPLRFNFSIFSPFTPVLWCLIFLSGICVSWITTRNEHPFSWYHCMYPPDVFCSS